MFWISLLVAVWLLCSGQAWAGPLSDRITAFPQITSPPPVQPSEGDLAYPDWLLGEWTMTSTLVEMVAPLAPGIVTPGFEGNRQYMDQPIAAPIRFKLARVGGGSFLGRSLNVTPRVVSDRAFNGLSLGRAYLGDDWITSVTIDPEDPNRQITQLKDRQQLISTITGRVTETPSSDTFITTELFQQFFRGDRPSVYLNQVENTTAYHYYPDAVPERGEPIITADQMTAIYLSPQDPDYFQAIDTPVALYRYTLTFQRPQK